MFVKQKNKKLVVLGMYAFLFASILSVSFLLSYSNRSIAPVESFASQGNINATVNINRSSSKSISKNIWGINGGPGDSFTDAHLSGLNLGMYRYPAGCQADNFNWRDSTDNYIWLPNNNVIRTKAQSVDDALARATNLGAELAYVINIETRVYANPCSQKSLYPGEGNHAQAIQDAKDIVRKYKGKIKYYEVGNEPWLSWKPSEYRETALNFARAMKSIDSNLQLGAVGFPAQYEAVPTPAAITKDQEWTTMVKSLIKEKCGSVDCFDYVTDHNYVWSGYDPTHSGAANFKGKSAYLPLGINDEIHKRRIADYAPKKLALTEWNLKCWGDDGIKSSGTVEHGMFVSENLFMMAKSGILMANYHALAPQRGLCMVMDKDNNYRPSGQAFQLASVIKGGTYLGTTYSGPAFNVPLDSTCVSIRCLRGGNQLPYVSAHSGYSANNELYTFIINRHENKKANVTINLNNFGSSSVRKRLEIKTLYANDFTNTNFQEANSTKDLSGTISLEVPRISITRVKITNIAANAPVVTSTTQPTQIQSPTSTVRSTTTNIPGTTGTSSTPTPSVIAPTPTDEDIPGLPSDETRVYPTGTYNYDAGYFTPTNEDFIPVAEGEAKTEEYWLSDKTIIVLVLTLVAILLSLMGTLHYLKKRR